MREIIAKIAEIDGLLVTLITGIITFLITKYTYHKSIPLDKLEITYNRLYYPIYSLMQNNDSNTEIIEKSKKYLDKYRKYADRSTIVAYNLFVKNADDKKACNNFRNNIFSINSKLRRRLGYLEPNIFSMYTYSAPNDKRLLRILMELAVVYISIGLYSVIGNDKIQQGIVVVFAIALIVLSVETVIGMIILVKNKLRGIISTKRK